MREAPHIHGDQAFRIDLDGLPAEGAGNAAVRTPGDALGLVDLRQLAGHILHADAARHLAVVA